MNKYSLPQGKDAFQVSTNPNNNNHSTIYQHNQPNQPQQYQIKPSKQILHQQKQSINTEQSIKYWFLSLGLFAAAFVIYVIVWAVQKFALNHQIASHYYQKSYNWSDALPTNHQVKVSADAKTIALDLVLQWVMWKGPLLLFTYNCIQLNQGKLKWILLGVSALILIAADIVLTVFISSVYNNMMYFALFSIVTIIMAVVANLSLGRVKQAVFDSLLPLLCIAVVFTIQVLGLPILYNVYTKNLSAEAAVFLTFYGYIFIDLIMYALILLLGSFTSKQVRTFYSQIHFLLVGYQVGFILLIGYTEVQFYYLLSYLIFRNIFTNWVMWKWDNIVKVPTLFGGWIVPYYFSYVLMFIPFSGVGNIVIGTGYYSIILVNTGTILYNIPSSLYPSDLFTPSTTFTDYQLNTSFQGDIFKIAALIIWIATTFSQRYSKKKPQIINTVVFNLCGLYLFYLGLSAGISTPSLSKYPVTG